MGIFLILQCLPFSLACFFHPPLLTLSLSLYICSSFLSVLFLHSLFHFFLFASFFYPFLSCLVSFAFISWEEQLQINKLDMFLSSILSVFFGFLSCFVFQIPFIIFVFSYLKLSFLLSMKVLCSKRQLIKYQYRNNYNNHKRGNNNLMRKNQKRKNKKNKND